MNQSIIESSVSDVINTTQNLFLFLDNKYIGSGVCLFLIVYSSLVGTKTKLHPIMRNLFNSEIFKILLLTVIAIIGIKNPVIAILAILAFVITIMAVSSNNIKSKESMAVIGEDQPQGNFAPAECPCKFPQEEQNGFDQYNVDQPLDYNDLNEEHELNVYNKCSGANHEIENMLKRRDGEIRMQLFPNVESLHQQNANIIAGGNQILGQEEQIIQEPYETVTMEDLAEEVNRRVKKVNGKATSEEVKAKCDEVVSEFRANVMRHYTRSEYNADGVIVGNDNDLTLYASA
jgi:hypothetical protein